MSATLSNSETVKDKSLNRVFPENSCDIFDSDIKMHLTPLITYFKNGVKDFASLEKDIINSYKEKNVENLQNQ